MCRRARIAPRGLGDDRLEDAEPDCRLARMGSAAKTRALRWQPLVPATYPAIGHDQTEPAVTFRRNGGRVQAESVAMMGRNTPPAAIGGWKARRQARARGASCDANGIRAVPGRRSDALCARDRQKRQETQEASPRPARLRLQLTSTLQGSTFHTSTSLIPPHLLPQQVAEGPHAVVGLGRVLAAGAWSATLAAALLAVVVFGFRGAGVFG